MSIRVDVAPYQGRCAASVIPFWGRPDASREANTGTPVPAASSVSSLAELSTPAPHAHSIVLRTVVPELERHPQDVIHPQFSLSPAVASGDGWEIEVRVSNLAALDLVLAVEAENFPGLRVSMLDLNSGQTVAAGTFGPGPFVRLRDNPAQLLVSDRSPTTNAYRLLIFDIEDGGLRLASELPLPLRYGYHGYNNAMRLSTDGRYLFISQRSRLETAECSQLNYDSNVCLRYEVGVLDLDAPTLVNSVAIPGPCGGMAFNAVSNDSIIVRCSFSNSTFEMNAAGVASERLVYDWVAAPGVPGQGTRWG